MNHRASLFLLATSVLSCGMFLVTACSSDRPAGQGGSSTSSTSSSSSSGGTSSGSSSGDGGSSSGDGGGPDLSGTCTPGDAHQGGTVYEVQMGGTIPAPMGGKVTPGLYDLNEQVIWGPRVDAGDEPGPGGMLTGNQVGASLRITETEAKLLTSEGTTSLGPDTFLGGSYKAEGTTFTLEGKCPSPSTKTFGYTASETSIVLYEGQKQRVFGIVPKPKK